MRAFRAADQPLAEISYFIGPGAGHVQNDMCPDRPVAAAVIQAYGPQVVFSPFADFGTGTQMDHRAAGFSIKGVVDTDAVRRVEHADGMLSADVGLQLLELLFRERCLLLVVAFTVITQQTLNGGFQLIMAALGWRETARLRQLPVTLITFG